MMFRSRFLVALVFLIAVAASLAAAERVVVVPPGPTSATPIELRLFIIACSTESHTLNRFGSLIKIHVDLGPMETCTPNPDHPLEHRVNLGTLPVGEYRVEVTAGATDNIRATRTFIVRNGSPSVLEVHPFVLPTGGLNVTRVRLHANGEPLCGTTTCEDVTIRVGGELVPRTDITATADGALTFKPPNHEEGLVEVVVTRQSGTTTLPGALYYFDHNGTDLSIFERILFPILEQSGGALGSQWVSEAAIANPKPWPIVNRNYVEPFVCILIDYPCFERIDAGQIRTFNGDGFPRGVLLYSPRAESPNLAFSLRVRDTSRQAEGFGTHIPIVRESEMFTNTALTLLDVPIDPRYRTKVRMYVLDAAAHTAQVTVVRPNEASVTERSRTYDVPVSAHDFIYPGYAEFDVPAGRADERAHVYVRIGDRETPSWAFASVTNNETQQVTIVTADGSGGVPVCDPCLP